MPTGNRPVLLLTRPQPDARRFAALLPEFQTVISPILRIAPVAHDSAALSRAEGLVFTSGHAVAAAGPGRGRLALCVGERTAQVAQAAGFRTRHGNGFAESLIPLIEAAEMALIHPHGRHLAKRLPVPGMVVYDQHEVALNAQAQALLAGGRPVLLPLFSPRSAQLLASQTVDARAEIWPVAISRAALERWGRGGAHSIIAERPDLPAMAEAVRALADRAGVGR